MLHPSRRLFSPLQAVAWPRFCAPLRLARVLPRALSSPPPALRRTTFSLRNDAWKRAYVYELDAARVLRLRVDGRVVDELALSALESVALRWDVHVGAWQWLLALRHEDAVRVLPHDDALTGHAQLSAALRALPDFAHRSYAEALTSPAQRSAAARARLLWRATEGGGE